MFLIKFTIALIAVACATASPLFNETNVGANCVITQFSQVGSVTKSCNNIVVQNLAVPAGKQLLLNLKSGTTLTFKGTTSFGYGVQWEGPMVLIKGNHLTVDGSGATLDGQGAHYWDGKGDSGNNKPKFFRIQAQSSTFSNIHLLNCPKQCTSVLNSNSVTLDKWNIDVSAGDRNHLGHNTDGFDVSASSGVTIKNSVVKNQDDCVALNSGSNIHIDNLDCSGGHGLSISVGVSKTDSTKNRLSDVTFSNSVVKNSRNGIHIKTHTDGAVGYMKDITYTNIKFQGLTNYGINVQENYKGGKSSGSPVGNIPIHGLKLNNIRGTMTGKDSEAVYVLCGSKGCDNFNWSGVSITGAHKSSYCNYKPSGYPC
ncbi:unnamed protein product [Phyllotreta striolata]|uniref:endo-polygalacturonase n=1 Tax=Phyllotreta striolata TaxID=444603 RepID=A0A9N9XUK3_PHYSR|nr:unnamed protein product [Phyllotreta striolata]